MNFKNILFLLLCLTTLNSCSKWIDVKPSDRLSEDVLFQDASGYLKALNGVYVELANNNLYGRFMTTANIDAMGQYYYISSSTNVFYDYAVFNYTTANTKSGFDNAWKKAYELIANLNVIIEKSGNAPTSKLPNPYYGIVRGEALALRAMLHFDMLRLFGPIWSESNKKTTCIPYVTFSKSEISPLLSSEEVMIKVEEDLNLALELLKENDSIFKEGIKTSASPTSPNDQLFRQYRFNYFAVQSLLARTNLWKGDKANALKNAVSVIQNAKIDGKAIFPFVTLSAAVSPDKPDRVFSTEVIFSLYTILRSNMYDMTFSANLEDFRRLSVNGLNSDFSRINAMYDNANDHRRRVWEAVNVAGKEIVTNQKYKLHTDAPGRYMIPLIRMSEMYLIAAECSENIQEAAQFLNAVRNSRNINNLTPNNPQELKNLITSEYRREFLGEGQIFFFYKRNSAQNIPNNASLVGDKNMSLVNYQVPLPDSEVSLRSKAVQ
ncbi:RagB/SusD family nutrient uptake outer membrane protein [Sphingobacterium tabacisoli]|uniref:RagB/SusD family nutrient uptake outer membrane protein n=1 Tax=Sphingobacterium tabacisoli TaxID=2044855 RepID=A0ABW5LA36_9SPHI|nr:RagB/SusD family nutrient uptake outer membrane protein [Sphingobacterium tabacisoli]